MKKSTKPSKSEIRRLERKFILSFILFVFVLLLSLTWWFNALKVDFNSIAYESEKSFAADMGRSLGDHGDSIYFRRLEMQDDDFWALRLASRLPWIGRMFISAIFAALTFFTALNALRAFGELFYAVNRRNKALRIRRGKG